jgi:sulfide:quinone oxidoreductase
MRASEAKSEILRVVVVGGGVASMETVLALHELAGERVALTMIAPNEEFVYRPMTVREPFAYAAARRYPLQRVARDTGATLVTDELSFVDRENRVAHTQGREKVDYDVLVLALGAHARPRYEHALTIDDRTLDETFHGLIQDIEDGYTESVAFVSPGRMAWPLPLYELALMTAGRASDMGIELETTVVTPEERPLAIFGATASDAVSGALARAGVDLVTSAYAEVPRVGEIVVNPGDRRMHARRIVALPELYGPAVRGIPHGEHGFIRVDMHGRVFDVEGVYAAGDAIDFPVKHGGIGTQQADAVAESIAAVAGCTITPKPFRPVIHGMLLTDGKPIYLTAHITGGQGASYSSQVTDTPAWSPGAKIAARYLGPYLETFDHEQEESGPGAAAEGAGSAGERAVKAPDTGAPR